MLARDHILLVNQSYETLLKNRGLYYVYVYLNPIKSGTFTYENLSFPAEPFYVGKGKNTRLVEHVSDYFVYKEKGCIRGIAWNKHKYHTIGKILETELKIPVQIFQFGITHEESCLLEISLIKTIGRSDLNSGPLTNMTDGGEGSYSRKMSETTRRKIGEANTGKKISEDTRAKLVEAQNRMKTWLGKKHSEETKKKIRDRNKIVLLSDDGTYTISKYKFFWTGRKHSDETKRKMSLKSRGRLHTKESKKANRLKHKGMIGKHPMPQLLTYVYCKEIDEIHTISAFCEALGLLERHIGKSLRKNQSIGEFKYKAGQGSRWKEGGYTFVYLNNPAYIALNSHNASI